ncbi:MAG: S9 family peptidase [Chitinophagaceae bacterium]
MRLKTLFLGIILFLFQKSMSAQTKMTPELLWQLGRVTGEEVAPDGQSVIYGVSKYSFDSNKSSSNLYHIPIQGGAASPLTHISGTANGVQFLPNGKIGYQYEGQWWEMNPDGTGAVQKTDLPAGMENIKISPDGKYILFTKSVKILPVEGKDFYPQFPKSNVLIYDNLNFRHWNKWNKGDFSHVFYATYDQGRVGDPVDIMKGEPFDCPQMPDGGPEDLIWSPDGKNIVYVCKKKFGKDYVTSTNTDLYFYNLQTGKTSDFTEGMKGYDMLPAFSPDGSRIAWTSMKTDGYESDKNDLVVYNFKTHQKVNLTRSWDNTVNSFRWSMDGKYIYFVAPSKGTIQLFSVALGRGPSEMTHPQIRQITHGDFDVEEIIGQSANHLVVLRTDMNHAAEIYLVNLTDGNISQLTTVNNDIYDRIALSKVEKRWVTTTDGKKELVWVIYPPNFNPQLKYPTLLYCQGGPQVPLSQFYSFRWNFQLMAANGYIVVAPNRRGLQGFGVKWNEAISRDFGGQPIRDYISAIDSISHLPFVDKNRIGCVGASYGGYSVYLLAGLYPKKFKTFIAHDGMFDTKSWYGTTDEMWFANHDLGMPYGKNKVPEAYDQFNPITYVDHWMAPILIIQGGIDYRVPVEQGLEAFKAAQMLGIKSKLLYFPDEDHFVLNGNNSLIWQHEFFKWLKETL